MNVYAREGQCVVEMLTAVAEDRERIIVPTG